MSKDSKAIDEVTEAFGPVAGLFAALFVIAAQVAKIYVIVHFVLKYW